MASYLVTGSSRGLWLALITRLATLPKPEVGTIITTARQDNSARMNEIASSSSGRVQIVLSVKLGVKKVLDIKQKATPE
ncbi:hypothetical protein PITC_098010 [Penicillium italicum]|uniref:Uncharacterized protein n=1 Tax=Penicillium italicum TaxID=40296 RepID=A0A0A2LBX1_PENIT|nr:hypothetical protein PITC_098010 [Penicillium italicum]